MLSHEQKKWALSMMDGTAGTLIAPTAMEEQIKTIVNNKLSTCDINNCAKGCSISKFELAESELIVLMAEIESDVGYLVKDSTVRFIVETLVNELIIRERQVCAEHEGVKFARR